MGVNEKNLSELQKSLDKIVESIENKTSEDEYLEQKFNHVDNEQIKEELDTPKKYNLFEKLGECMERENKTEEELKMEVNQDIKDELKNEILNELKNEIKNEFKSDNDEDKIADSENNKWFSILNKDGTTCEGIHLTAGNKWDNGVGACTRDNVTELKIPVFPPPNSGSSYLPNSCDSPAPLQMTAEESLQLEYIKKHGLPKPGERKAVPNHKRFGWWRILDTEQLKEVLDNLHVRGVRERELKRTFVSTMQSMYERQGKLLIEEGCKESTELTGMGGSEEVKYLVEGAPEPDSVGSWSQEVAHRIDLFLLEQVWHFIVIVVLCDYLVSFNFLRWKPWKIKLQMPVCKIRAGGLQLEKKNIL